MSAPAVRRVPLLALGILSLVLGALGGLARLGVRAPASDAAVLGHGALMVSGFFGTVIGVERAVATGKAWAFAGPVLSGAGGVALLAGAERPARALFAASGVVLTAASAVAVARMPASFTVTLALGAAAWLAGSAEWLAGAPLAVVAPWWLAFLVVTIAGERLELSRLVRPPAWAARAFGAVVALLFAALVLGRFAPALAGRALGASLLLLSAWLARWDIARSTVRQRGLTRFIAVCLLSGYAWLALAGGVLVSAGALAPGRASYDAAIHALSLGFVFSMVFGHAPIIVPAVARVTVAYHPVFYAPLALLHASLAMRLAGDALGEHALRAAGGTANAVALAAFVLNTLAAILRGRGARVTSARAPRR